MRRAAVALVVGVLLAGCGGGTDRGPVSAPRPAPPPTTPHPTPQRATDPSLEPSTAPVQRPSATVIAPVGRADLGRSWHPGCPVGPADLRLVAVRYLGFDDAMHTGRLVVAAGVTRSVVAIFRELLALRFPIRRMVPISAYAGEDERSMEADNTSAYNCRPATGGIGWSRHAFGTALDLNPLENPYVSGAVVQPRTAHRSLDRTRSDPGMIHAGDRIVSVFARHGWRWGGNWAVPRDYQHFQT